MIKIKFTIVLLCTIPLYMHPQKNYSPYNFLNLQDNQFKNTEKANYYTYLMDKFAGLCINNKEKISVLHIGDSHIQPFFNSKLQKK